MVSNTGRKNCSEYLREEKMVPNTGRKNDFEYGAKKMLTLSSIVRAYLHDVFDKELLPVLLPCACHQVVVQLNKKHCITNYFFKVVKNN
jgi:hypothetical protein